MKVYLSTFESDPHLSPNPFVYTLMDSMLEEHDDVQIETHKDVFWTEDICSFDIIHIMWPDALLIDGKHTYTELCNQLKLIKRSKAVVVCTCHNLHSNNTSENAILAYDLVYQYADYFIHLGKYSSEVLKDKYPKAAHKIIPHHVYDTVYTHVPSKKDALKKLSLSNKLYAISFGAFRNSNERDLFFRLADSLKKYQVYCIAPSFMDIPKGKINSRWLKQRLKKIYWQIKHPNTILGGEYVSDELLPYYYAASDISIIQRIDILNSGNVPLGMYFGNLILGPNVGNVNEILTETDNFVFDINNLSNIDDICQKMLASVEKQKGIKNREYVLSNLTTKKIAEETYQLYKSLILTL